ncbi:hypothetical protein, partial [Priestia megaterium]|uniref:hypothetical protein n=1 Tax=Priestia megaterium TaxID=1404 RepID=UPI001C99A4C5
REMKCVDMERDEVVIRGKSNDRGVVGVVGVLNKKEIGNLKEEFKEKYGCEGKVRRVWGRVGKEVGKNGRVGILNG